MALAKVWSLIGTGLGGITRLICYSRRHPPARPPFHRSQVLGKFTWGTCHESTRLLWNLQTRRSQDRACVRESRLSEGRPGIDSPPPHGLRVSSTRGRYPWLLSKVSVFRGQPGHFPGLFLLQTMTTVDNRRVLSAIWGRTKAKRTPAAILESSITNVNK